MGREIANRFDALVVMADLGLRPNGWRGGPVGWLWISPQIGSYPPFCLYGWVEPGLALVLTSPRLVVVDYQDQPTPIKGWNA